MSLDEIRDILLRIEKKLPEVPIDQNSTFNYNVLFSLPDHLRKTALVLLKLGFVTASDVAAQTKRARAVESAYLNVLVIMGYVTKEKKGRKTFFAVKLE
jgi:hypothetical protein